VTTGGGSSAHEVLLEGDTNITTEEVATSDPAGMTGPASGAFPSIAVADDDVAIEEPGVMLGHPTLRAPEDGCLDEAMGTTCWALT
jgi:hypothetical protein